LESDSETSEIFARNKAAAFSERKESAVAENSENPESGGVLFSRHFRIGTRPTGELKPWDTRTFIDAPLVEFGERSLSNYLNGKRPSRKNAIAILQTLFGPNPDHKIEREKLGRAWGVTETDLQSLTPIAEPLAPTAPRAPTPSAAGRRRIPHPRLMEFTIGTAGQHETETTFGVLGEFRFGIDPYREMKAAIGMGLSRVDLETREVGCRPLPKEPRLGEPAPTKDGVRAIAGGWEIVAPAGKHLDLKIVDVLMQFERIPGEGPPTVTITASAYQDDLVPVWRNPPPDISAAQKAVLSQYLKHRCFPKEKRFHLGTDTLDGSPRPPRTEESQS